MKCSRHQNLGCLVNDSPHHEPLAYQKNKEAQDALQRKLSSDHISWWEKETWSYLISQRPINDSVDWEGQRDRSDFWLYSLLIGYSPGSWVAVLPAIHFNNYTSNNSWLIYLVVSQARFEHFLMTTVITRLQSHDPFHNFPSTSNNLKYILCGWWHGSSFWKVKTLVPFSLNSSVSQQNFY